MPGIASDMTLLDFLRRLLLHATLAASVLTAVLLLGEFLVPGSVLPFIDLIDLLPILFAFVVATVLWGPERRRA